MIHFFCILDWMLKHLMSIRSRSQVFVTTQTIPQGLEWEGKSFGRPKSFNLKSHSVILMTPECPLCEYCTAVFIISVNSISKRFGACSLTPSPETHLTATHTLTWKSDAVYRLVAQCHFLPWCMRKGKVCGGQNKNQLYCETNECRPSGSSHNTLMWYQW